MTQQVLSRSQRRMERKQTIFMLSMVLVVGLVCFFLGVMVGKSGEQSQIAEEHLSVQEPAVAQKNEVTDPEPTETPEGPGSSAGAPDPQLTFYDTLPEGRQNAIGSGINLPPEPKTVEPAVPAASVPEPVAEKTPAKTVAPPKPTPPPPAAPKAQVNKPATVASGGYIVQVASVKQLQGANGLRDRMVKKGYTAFVEAADLGAKGVWYRVYAGPFGSRGDADQAVSALKADRISSAPLVKRR